MPTFSGSVAGELQTGAVVAGDVDEVSESGLIADPADIELGDPEPHHAMEPVDELATSDEAVQESTDFGTVPSVASTYSSSALQDVVQASVDRAAAEMGAGEADSAETDAITVDISPEDGSWSIEPIASDVENHDEESDDPEQQMNVDSDVSSDVEQGPESSSSTENSEYNEDDSWLDESGGTATTVLVHGVPRATTALSLKRYLEGLEQVHNVEPREYAEGVLRLQVSSDRPVGISDLRGWPEADDLEPVEVRDDFLEVRLGN
jgi:hypothetical protein